MPVMAGWSDNIEAVARALCAKQLAREEWSDEKLAFEVDMWWHLVAAELESGVLDEAGEFVGGEMGWKRKMDGYRGLDAPPSREPSGLGNGSVRSTATPRLRCAAAGPWRRTSGVAEFSEAAVAIGTPVRSGRNSRQGERVWRTRCR